MKAQDWEHYWQRWQLLSDEETAEWRQLLEERRSREAAHRERARPESDADSMRRLARAVNKAQDAAWKKLRDS